MTHEYPVGKAQKVILEALGRNDIESFQEAEAFFDAIGITVVARREGRKSVPSVSLKEYGGFTAYGEGDTSEAAISTSDLVKIEQWIEKK